MVISSHISTGFRLTDFYSDSILKVAESVGFGLDRSTYGVLIYRLRVGEVTGGLARIKIDC
jgi:hypothetical protein